MKAVVLLAGAFVGSFALFTAQPVKAVGWERVSPGGCAIDVSDSNNFFFAVTGGGPLQNTSGGTYHLACGVNDSNQFDIGGVQGKQNISTLNIHGEDRHSSGSVSARACVSFFHVTGGECGTPHNSGGGFLGPYTLQPSRVKWGSAFAAHFGYIHISIPPQTGNGASTFSGYFVGAP